MEDGTGVREGLLELVAWAAYGGGRGVPVLALHGVTDSGAVWAPLVEHLAGQRLVVTVDARGHGRSGLPNAPLTMAALAGDAASVVRVVVGRPVVVVGHSLGGIVAQELALAEPELVAGLVLEDPAWRVDREVGARGVPLWLPGAVASFAGRSQAQLEAWSRAENPGWPDDEHAPWAASKREVDPRLTEVPHEWAGRDWVESLADIRVPVTLVTGDVRRGGIVDSAQVARAQELLGRAPEGLLTHVAAPGAGHNVRREAREIFFAAVDAALSRAQQR